MLIHFMQNAVHMVTIDPFTVNTNYNPYCTVGQVFWIVTDSGNDPSK